MKSDLLYIEHIFDEINFIIENTKNISFSEFMENEILKRAITRSLEIIGEATKNISLNIKNNYKDIDWKNISGMRDKIIHFYFGINWEIVWDVVRNKIPELKVKMSDIKNELIKFEK